VQLVALCEKSCIFVCFLNREIITMGSEHVSLCTHDTYCTMEDHPHGIIMGVSTFHFHVDYLSN